MCVSGVTYVCGFVCICLVMIVCADVWSVRVVWLFCIHVILMCVCMCVCGGVMLGVRVCASVGRGYGCVCSMQ